jgi:hypothetical protein
MTVNKDTFALFIILLIYIGGDIYTTRVEHNKLKALIKTNEEYSAAALFRHVRAEARIDSLKVETKGLAKTIIYLDSCQSEKVRKGEKAERTGRFVGGIIKGLFPHL